MKAALVSDQFLRSLAPFIFPTSFRLIKILSIFSLILEVQRIAGKNGLRSRLLDCTSAVVIKHFAVSTLQLTENIFLPIGISYDQVLSKLLSLSVVFVVNTDNSLLDRLIGYPLGTLSVQRFFL